MRHHAARRHLPVLVFNEWWHGHNGWSRARAHQAVAVIRHSRLEQRADEHFAKEHSRPRCFVKSAPNATSSRSRFHSRGQNDHW
jgi:hypothetical protein